MIDFDEELKKYQPILEIDDIGDSIHSNELKDILDVLNYMARKKEDSSRN